jgi:hypothetical protein
MDLSDITLETVARTAGHLLGGTVGTLVVGLGLLRVLQPLQTPVFDAFYLQVGPWTAEVTATVLVFVLAGSLALALPTLLSVAVRTGTDDLQPLVVGLAVLVGVLVVGIATWSLAGLEVVLAAVLALVVVAVAVPAGLYRVGTWPDGVAAYVGGLPVLVLLLAALAFGLGWGGGYYVVAEEVPAEDVDTSAAAAFSEAPELRDALLDPSQEDIYANCAQDEGRRTCRLDLRGYDDEATAARFLDSHGVRCPYRNAPSRETPGDESFVAEADGTYYRVTCETYGD